MAWEFLLLSSVLPFAHALHSGYYYYNYGAICVGKAWLFTEIPFWIGLLLSKEEGLLLSKEEGLLLSKEEGLLLSKEEGLLLSKEEAT